MNMLVCIKRVPDVGAKINLKEDLLSVDEKNLGYTISPHEECCVQEAVNILADREGSSTVLTIGSEDAIAQLRDCLARGISDGVLLESDVINWDPMQIAECLSTQISSIEKEKGVFDLILFGAESADLENGQTPLRVASQLNRPCLSRISALEVKDDELLAKRETEEGMECYEMPLPAILSLKDGINLPKHPSLRGTMSAKRKKVETIAVEPGVASKKLMKFINVEQNDQQAEILGEGPTAADEVVKMLKNLEVLV